MSRILTQLSNEVGGFSGHLARNIQVRGRVFSDRRELMADRIASRSLIDSAFAAYSTNVAKMDRLLDARCLRLQWMGDANKSIYRSQVTSTLTHSAVCIQIYRCRYYSTYSRSSWVVSCRNCRPVLSTCDNPPPMDSARYVLFFDGGSKGNPGPGGAGSVIIQTTDTKLTATVLWSAAASLARTSTTNNQAEYMGLITGLKKARAEGWTPLEIVGDNQLILRQMQLYRSPRNPELKDKYAEARRLADVLRITEWKHHPREFNTMADAAANAAMDTRASSQVTHPTTRAEHQRIATYLEGDFQHWQLQ